MREGEPRCDGRYRKQGVPQFKFTPYLRWPPVTDRLWLTCDMVPVLEAWEANQQEAACR
jgi:hypothetical protein